MAAENISVESRTLIVCAPGATGTRVIGGGKVAYSDQHATNIS